MRSIGGYFGLELSRSGEFHQQAIKLNTGRNALEYILRANNYRKIFLPYYTCDVLLQPVKKTGIEVEFYTINDKLEPDFDFGNVKGSECFLYTNYFGIKDKAVSSISKVCKNLIVDNAQSFFSAPVSGVDTFYSPRKFFGLPDGAYLYSKNKISGALEQDVSFERFEHLLKRVDISAESGYEAFVRNDKSLDNMPILQMSNITESLLASIDYNAIADKRKENFLFLHQELQSKNELKFEWNNDQVPMVYPYLCDGNLKETLVRNRIYTPTYWPNVVADTKPGSIEYTYANRIVFLPVDQRVNLSDLKQILKYT